MKLPDLVKIAPIPLPVSMNFYHALRPFLFRMDAEAAHDFTLRLLKKGWIPGVKQAPNRRLHANVCDISFPSPIGLAAGFDKNAEVINDVKKLGFGFVEVGSITPLPQPGNPAPRVFRVPGAKAVINRYGFNSKGMEYCLREIIAWHDAHMRDKRGALGINLGKNKDTTDAAADYITGIYAFAPFADYLTINISSPNTPGLRDLQNREQLADLLQRVMAARDETRTKPPIFLKIAPDLTEQQQEDIAATAVSSGVQGLIIGNTTITRPGKIPPTLAAETGGLSGKPLFALSTQVLTNMYRLTKGAIPLIGCGGVASAEDAYAKIRAGASLVQLYTALIYEGPYIVKRINRGLATLLERDGFATVTDAVGIDVK
jgi:dihydroorotate dehydrogenase